MKKLKNLSIFLLFSLVITFLAPGALALEPPEIASKSVILIDVVTGDEIFSQNADTRAFPASLTKMITVLLAVEAIEAGQVSPDDEITATEAHMFDLIADGSTADIVPGETMTLTQLLYCAMVVSANEACNMIAEHVGGSVENFVSMMNERAKELGCTGTNFRNTHGLPDEGHYTTATDMALFAKEAVGHALFMEICGTQSTTIPATNKTDKPRELVNTNALLGDNEHYKGYTYEYASGIKTGHTNDAGYCLISTATKDEIAAIAVVMGGESKARSGGGLDVDSFADSITLYDWLFENYSYRNILEYFQSTTVSVPVEMGDNADSVAARPGGAITALLPYDVDISEFDFETVIYSEKEGTTLQAPIEKDEVLGEIAVYRNGTEVGNVKLVAANSIDLSKMVYMKSEVQKFFQLAVVRIAIVVLVLLILGYAFLVIRYKILRARHVASLRRARRERDAMQNGSYLQMDESYFADRERSRGVQHRQQYREAEFPREHEYAGRRDAPEQHSDADSDDDYFR